MIQFLIGFSVGIYLGTYYNCRPLTDSLIKCIKNKMPVKREK